MGNLNCIETLNYLQKLKVYPLSTQLKILKMDNLSSIIFLLTFILSNYNCFAIKCESSCGCPADWFCNMAPMNGVCKKCSHYKTKDDCILSGFSTAGTNNCIKTCTHKKHHHGFTRQHGPTQKFCNNSNDCQKGWMCNMNPDNSFCEDCSNFLTKEECAKTRFISQAGTDECYSVCFNENSWDNIGDWFDSF